MIVANSGLRAVKATQLLPDGAYLKSNWHLMGAMEALNGWLLFGLTTAFLFAVLEKVWSLGGTKEQQ